MKIYFLFYKIFIYAIDTFLFLLRFETIYETSNKMFYRTTSAATDS